MHDLYAALCLVLVVEGLLLFVAPRSWQKMVEQAAQADPSRLRTFGGIAIAAGLVLLQWVNH